MSGPQFLGLLGILVFGSLVGAQPPAEESAPPLLAPELQRLPPVSLPAAVPEEVVQPPAEPTPAAPEAKPAAKPWTGSFKLGLDGSEGNSEVLNFRFGFDAKRNTKAKVVTLDLDYHKSMSEDAETANRAFFDWRFERFLDQSHWTSFVHGTVDYDEFKVFDVRVTADFGLGYYLVKTEKTS